MTDLKPCPWCLERGHPVPRISAAGRPILHYVECARCEATGPACNTEAEAITAWNRRAPAPQVRADMIEALALKIAVHDGCGLSIKGRRALCTDPEAERPAQDCFCRDVAGFALDAALAAPAPQVREEVVEECARVADVIRKAEKANKARNPASELGGTATANIIAIKIRALSGLPSPGMGGQWQPISTAKQDSSMRIVGFNDLPKERWREPEVLRWSNVDRRWNYDSPHGPSDRAPFYPPTHWQPLPAPPIDDAGSPQTASTAGAVDRAGS